MAAWVHGLLPSRCRCRARTTISCSSAITWSSPAGHRWAQAMRPCSSRACGSPTDRSMGSQGRHCVHLNNGNAMADDNLQGSHHMLINRNLGALAVATFLTSACTAASDGQTGPAREEPPSYSVSLPTDSSAYDSGKPIVVTYDGLPGDPTDWISLTPSEESDYNFVAWQYTDGSASGQVSFTANLPPGTYVARAYPLDGYERAGQSAAFTVGLEGVSVS